MIPRSPRSRFWAISLLSFVLVLWTLKAVLLPFVAGLIIAYFLNPSVNLLCRITRLPRWLGSLLILLGFIACVVLVTLLTLPLLQQQISALMDALPGYLENARIHLLPWAERLLTKLPASEVAKLKSATGEYASNVVGWSGNLLKSLISSGGELIQTTALIILTPVISFYLLRDWPKLIANIDSLLPRKPLETIHAQLHEIDRTLSGFIRGQALVCVCLGLIYSVGLSAVGLKYGATIGIIAGVLSFIPYAGSTFVLVSSLLLAFVQFNNTADILTTLSVFLIGQSLEGYFLTPKLVGDRVGLHPVWILFAIFAGANLFGFLGVLIAVPVAAMIGVLARFAIQQYKSSSLYYDPQL